MSQECGRVVMMDKYGYVRSRMSAVAMLFFLLTSPCVVAADLFINIDAAGSLDARFHGLDILATIAGEGALVGDVSRGGSSIWLSASGVVAGVGHRNILSLVTKGWIVMSAFGATEDSEPVTIRCLLYASRQRLIPLQADDLIEGVHHTVIQVGESISVYWGEFAGTLAGGLAPTETSGTIRLSGSGSFYLSGEWVSDASCDAFSDAIPLDDPDLPATFLQIIYDELRTDSGAN
ncbi:hypothetical protein ACFLSZ_00365 [Candidatus Bipolaricaulota bacterium]